MRSLFLPKNSSGILDVREGRGENHAKMAVVRGPLMNPVPESMVDTQPWGRSSEKGKMGSDLEKRKKRKERKPNAIRKKTTKEDKPFSLLQIKSYTTHKSYIEI